MSKINYPAFIYSKNMAKKINIDQALFDLPIIKSINDFSELTHISKYTLYQLSINSDKYYRTYTIPKKNGKLREINQPSKKLKGLQSWILVNILNKLSVSPNCKGFQKGTSTADNAKIHVSAKALLTIDLENFFPTITQKHVFNIFRCIGYNDIMSVFFSNICTFREFLPQGSPCSPMLSNLCTWNLDSRIEGYVSKKGIKYTRYADDMSFSSQNSENLHKIKSMINRIITEEQFRINESKTRLATQAQTRKITGLILSEDSFGIGREKYKELRSKIFYLTLPPEQNNIKLKNNVLGWLAYLKSVDEKRFIKAKKYIAILSEKKPNTLVSCLIGTTSA